MSIGVFIVRDDNNLVVMRFSAFESEGLLQEFLATHTSLIAGDAVDSTNPRRCLLIARGQAVQGQEGKPGQLWLDNLSFGQIYMLLITNKNCGRVVYIWYII